MVYRNEVEAVVSFYEELCQLAQVLKAVDPFCMLFLQQVSHHSNHHVLCFLSPLWLLSLYPGLLLPTVPHTILDTTNSRIKLRTSLADDMLFCRTEALLHGVALLSRCSC